MKGAKSLCNNNVGIERFMKGEAKDDCCFRPQELNQSEIVESSA